MCHRPSQERVQGRAVELCIGWRTLYLTRQAASGSCAHAGSCIYLQLVGTIRFSRARASRRAWNLPCGAFCVCVNVC